MEKYEDRIRDFMASWKQLFGWLDFGNIDEFEEKYRGSNEELCDLKAAYMTHDGDMETVIAELRCCTLADIERHCHTLQSLIDSRQLSHLKNFTRSAAQLRRRAAAAQQQISAAATLASESNRGSEASTDSEHAVVVGHTGTEFGSMMRRAGTIIGGIMVTKNIIEDDDDGGGGGGGGGGRRQAATGCRMMPAKLRRPLLSTIDENVETQPECLDGRRQRLDNVEVQPECSDGKNTVTDSSTNVKIEPECLDGKRLEDVKVQPEHLDRKRPRLEIVEVQPECSDGKNTMRDSSTNVEVEHECLDGKRQRLENVEIQPETDFSAVLSKNRQEPSDVSIDELLSYVKEVADDDDEAAGLASTVITIKSLPQEISLNESGDKEEIRTPHNLEQSETSSEEELKKAIDSSKTMRLLYETLAAEIDGASDDSVVNEGCSGSLVLTVRNDDLRIVSGSSSEPTSTSTAAVAPTYNATDKMTAAEVAESETESTLTPGISQQTSAGPSDPHSTSTATLLPTTNADGTVYDHQTLLEIERGSPALASAKSEIESTGTSAGIPCQTSAGPSVITAETDSTLENDTENKENEEIPAAQRGRNRRQNSAKSTGDVTASVAANDVTMTYGGDDKLVLSSTPRQRRTAATKFIVPVKGNSVDE